MRNRRSATRARVACEGAHAGCGEGERDGQRTDAGHRQSGIDDGLRSEEVEERSLGPRAGRRARGQPAALRMASGDTLRVSIEGRSSRRVRRGRGKGRSRARKVSPIRVAMSVLIMESDRDMRKLGGELDKIVKSKANGDMLQRLWGRRREVFFIDNSPK